MTEQPGPGAGQPHDQPHAPAEPQAPAQPQAPPPPAPAGQSVAVQKPAKDKTVAILLAVFLGFWSWIYTWQADQTKFWIFLAVGILTLGLGFIVAWIWAIVNMATRDDAWYAAYPNVPEAQKA